MSMESYDREDVDLVERPTSSSSIGKELSQLIKQGDLNDYAVLSKLRAKHKDPEFINQVFDHWKERLTYITKRARKFKQQLMEKYGTRNLPQKDLLLKAKKWQKYLGLNDDEFKLAIDLLFGEQPMMTGMTAIPTTKMSKMLGFAPSIMSSSEKLKVGPKDEAIVQNILKLHATTKGLHEQVVLQSLTYRDCAPEALTGKFNPDIHNMYNYISPVLAALFLPRFKLIDDNMLIANIGNIVKCKNEGKPLETLPEHELYNYLIRDPNDEACSMGSAITDLHKRFFLQTRLWDCVLNLRQGRYYADCMKDFNAALSTCRQNVYDSPDMAYTQDEGALLRRLMSAFSLRPTMVSSSSVYGGMDDSSAYGVGAFNQIPGVGDISNVPMMTLRLPLRVPSTQEYATHLNRAVNQTDWKLEKGSLVPRSQQVQHSTDVLFYYVNRRYSTVNVASMGDICNFNTLPMTVSGFEALNPAVVNFDFTTSTNYDTYELRSVVVVEANKFQRSLIVGASALIVLPADEDKNFPGRKKDHIVYDPQGSGLKHHSAGAAAGNDGSYSRDDPITWIPRDNAFEDEDKTTESFYTRASKRGTLFLYQKKVDFAGVFTNGCRMQCD